MKSMIKIMTLAVLLTLLMPGIYGDAYGIYDADSNELRANVGIGPYCGVCVGTGVPDGPFYRRGDSRIALGTFMNVPYK